jgi:hypothetical protein
MLLIGQAMHMVNSSAAAGSANSSWLNNSCWVSDRLLLLMFVKQK